MGLRLGERPRIVATTTPRPVPLVRTLAARDDVAVTGGRTEDNREHLAADFLAAMEETYARHAARAAGARRRTDRGGRGRAVEPRADRALPRAARRPRGARRRRRRSARGGGAASDACGIVVVALGADGIGYVLDDASVQGLGPEGWARAVSAAAERHGADRVIAEANNGGAMVESVLRAASATLPVRLVHASRGKSARAEPVAVLYEKGRVAHVGAFPALEDEMAGCCSTAAMSGPGARPIAPTRWSGRCTRCC